MFSGGQLRDPPWLGPPRGGTDSPVPEDQSENKPRGRSPVKISVKRLDPDFFARRDERCNACAGRRLDRGGKFTCRSIVEGRDGARRDSISRGSGRPCSGRALGRSAWGGGSPDATLPSGSGVILYATASSPPGTPIFPRLRPDFASEPGRLRLLRAPGPSLPAPARRAGDRRSARSGGRRRTVGRQRESPRGDKEALVAAGVVDRAEELLDLGRADDAAALGVLALDDPPEAIAADPQVNPLVAGAADRSTSKPIASKTSATNSSKASGSRMPS